MTQVIPETPADYEQMRIIERPDVSIGKPRAAIRNTGHLAPCGKRCRTCKLRIPQSSPASRSKKPRPNSALQAGWIRIPESSQRRAFRGWKNIEMLGIVIGIGCSASVMALRKLQRKLAAFEYRRLT